VSTYSVVVALHIIAVVAAYGLPLSAPLLAFGIYLATDGHR
jgi:hypothetical protein